MIKVESYTTNVIIFDYINYVERDKHIREMEELGYFPNITSLNPTRVTYTKIFKEMHEKINSVSHEHWYINTLKAYF